MRRVDPTLVLSGAAVIALVFVAVRHRPEGVTPSRIEEALAPTFGNLVNLERARLGMPGVDRSLLQASAQCRKAGATARASQGAGEWTCTLRWSSPGQHVALRDAYDLSVTPDGCYTATADSAEAHLGGPTIKARDGATLTNLLYRFEGCFDTTGR